MHCDLFKVLIKAYLEDTSAQVTLENYHLIIRLTFILEVTSPECNEGFVLIRTWGLGAFPN